MTIPTMQPLPKINKKEFIKRLKAVPADCVYAPAIARCADNPKAMDRIIRELLEGYLDDPKIMTKILGFDIKEVITKK